MSPRVRPLRALRSRAVRRAVLSPDVERYLGRTGVDLMITDQVEALVVRIERGLDVLRRRLADGRKAARRQMALSATVALPAAGMVAYGGRALLLASSTKSVLAVLAPIALAVAGSVALGTAATMLARGLGDLRVIRSVIHTYTLPDEIRADVTALQDHGERILAEARVLGVVPPPETPFRA